MPLRNRRSRQGGNLMAVAFATIFILITVVAALHHQQMLSQRNFTQDEAELQFRQGYEWAVAEKLGKTSGSPPDWVKVRGDVETLHEGLLPDLAGGKLFEGLPDLEVDEETEQPPGYEVLDIEPTTSDGALRVFGDRVIRTVFNNAAGYAAYAPKGGIKAHTIYGWSNPSFDAEGDADEAYSGVPAWIRAGLKIDVFDFRYGRAYSDEGPIDIEEGLAVAFEGQPPPFEDYADKVFETLNNARNQLDASAYPGDKTNQIKGGIADPLSDMVDLLLSQEGELSLTLEQAMKLPIPMIPQVSLTAPPFFFEFYLHVPVPADGQFDQGNSKEAEQNAKEAHEAAAKVDEAQKNLDKVKNDPDADEDDIEDAQDELNDAKEDAEDKLNDLKDDAEARTQEIMNQIAGGLAEVPQTREDDEDIPKTGTPGWNYSRVIGGILGMLWNLAKAAISLDSQALENVGKSFYEEVRLVHFGGKDNVPKFTFDNNTFVSEATWTVPPGRAFRYQGNMEIEGDLWIQKGAVFAVSGNLTVKDPGSSSTDPFDPCGKVFLEEGASLIVSGDFQCEGSDRFGSLIVAGKAGTVPPITTAILCGGTVNLPYGTFTGATLEDLARWVSDKAPAAASIADGVKPLLENAPNLAKASGPFHTRKPYFAQYASTFQLTIVPTPFGPVPVPSPIPLPKPNLLVSVFRGLTLTYAPFLNYTLGENLYAHADWWAFGEGRVPLAPKVDPTRIIDGLGGISLPDMVLNENWGNKLQELLAESVKGAVTVFMAEVVGKLTAQVLSSFIPGGSLIFGALEGVLGKLVDLDDLLGTEMSLGEAITAPFKSAAEDLVNELSNEVEGGLAETYLREVNGVLIFADTIEIGYQNGSPVTPTPPMVAGMLVAKNNLRSNCTYTVGSVMTTEGSIEVRNLLFLPFFTRASLYQPEATASNWAERGLEVDYGASAASGLGIDLGLRDVFVTSEGWTQ